MPSIFFDGFPKEFGYKRTIVNNRKELLDLITRYNGKENLFTSIYRYPLWRDTPKGQRPIYEHAVIPAVYFDIDSWERSYYDMLKLHKWCKEKNIRHFVLFSGRGYHVYVFIEYNFKENSSRTLWSFSNYLESKLEAEFDNTAKGNLAKISRIPGTYNMKRDAFCNPLTEQQILDTDYQGHKKLCQKQNIVDPIIGNSRLDISAFSEKTYYSRFKNQRPDLKDADIQPSIEAAIRVGLADPDLLPPCIENALMIPNLNYDGRSVVIKYFMELGYNYGEVKEIFRHSLSPDKFRHALDSHMGTMFSNGFRRALSCDELKLKGFCPGCERDNPFDIDI